MTGYEKVANFMIDHEEMAVFKRFKFLNILDALYRQAELEHLEVEMKGYMKAGFPPGGSEASDSEEELSDGESECHVRDSGVSGITACDGDTIAENSSTGGDATDIQTNGTATSQDTPSSNGQANNIQMQSLSMRSSTPPPSPPPIAATDWWCLANEDGNKDAWNTMLTARQKLKEYSPSAPSPLLDFSVLTHRR